MPLSLATAFAISLLIHLLAVGSAALTSTAQPPTPTPAPLLATLQPPEIPNRSTAEFILPDPETAIKPIETRTPAKQPEKQGNSAVDRKKTAKTWTEAIHEQFSAQQESGLFYPEDAIRLGLQGEALVLLMLDENGNVLAARIEESSGHELLDQAALQAVRRLRALPSDAPIESLLPVRFRLR